MFKKTFGGGEGGGDKYFFPTNIREKEETPFGTQLKKKIILSSVQVWGKIRQESKYFQEQSYRIRIH